MAHFVVANPDSAWTPSLRHTLAQGDRSAGRHTLALEHWNSAWQKLKKSDVPAGREIANHALAGQVELYSSLGRVDKLQELLQEAAGREITEHNDRRRVETAREAYVMMLDHPALSYRCGSLALANIARQQGRPPSAINALIEEPSTTSGISLARLVQLSREHGLGLVAVKRTDAVPVPVPAVVHWSQNHYGAVLEHREDIDFYKIVDPTFGEPHWISGSNLNAEASGYFLVLSNQISGSWSLVSPEECASVWGRGFPYLIKDERDRGCKTDPTQPMDKCVPCEGSVQGMPGWWVSEPYINLWLADEPWTYTSSRGEQMPFRVTVKQRDALTNATSYPRPQVLHNWYSKIVVKGMSTGRPFSEAFTNWTATVHLSTGGEITFTKGSMYDEGSKIRLDTAFGVPKDGVYPETFVYWGSNHLSGWRVFYPDGSYDRYTLTYGRTNTVEGVYEQEALWAAHYDPLGNATFLHYDTRTGSNGETIYRLKRVTDYDGNNTTFTYTYNTPSYPDLLATLGVTSPYSQTATLKFGAPSGSLTNITDAEGLGTGLVWSQGRVSQLNTPYSQTIQFSYYEETNTLPMGGHNRINRALTVSEPGGVTNLYVYRFDGSNILPLEFPANDVPQSTPLGTLDTGTNTVDASTNYVAVSFKNSFHWDPRQYATLSTSVITNFTTNDYLKARMRHWLGDSNNVAVSDLISVEQEPSPDGVTPGHKTFYDYAGKMLKYLQGAESLPGVVARRQPSGATEYTWSRYNTDGFLTNQVSTFAAADGTIKTRTNSFIYAPATNFWRIHNNFETNSLPPGVTTFYLKEGFLRPTNGEVPAITLTGANAYGHTATSAVIRARLLTRIENADGTSVQIGGYSHEAVAPQPVYNLWWDSGGPIEYTRTVATRSTAPLPTDVTNQAGYVTSFAYNNDNRLKRIRHPSGLTTTNKFDANGFLTDTIDLEIKRTNTFTYQNGMVRVHENERGLRTTNTWDELQRLTGRSDSEGYVSNRYDRLDLFATRDKLGGWTYFGYDALHRLTAITNANGDVTQASYCKCGTLDSLTDSLGKVTSFSYDLAGRLTNVLHPDGFSVANMFNALNQLVRVTDSVGSTTNVYNLQGLLALSVNAAGVIRSNSYDVLDRPIATMDSAGVTTTLAYDALSRLLTNILGGTITNAFAWSANGLVRATDGLGNATGFTNDVLGRPLFTTNANGELTQFAYDNAGSLTNLFDGRTNRTRFQYDRFGRLTNKVDAAGASVLRLTYDANGRVLTRTTAKGTTTYVRDVLGRVRTNVYPHDVPVIFAYDANSRLTSLSDTNGTTSFTYTPVGQLSSENGPWANDVVTNVYAAGLRASQTLGSWQTTYSYDGARRLTGITSGAGSFTYGYYGAGDLIRKLSLPGGAFKTNTFDGAGRMLSAALKNSSLTTLDSHAYTYDSDSRRTSVTRTDGSVVTNSYDKIGQLKIATAKESGGTARLNEQFGYAYDKAGNLTQRTNNALTLTFVADVCNQLSNVTRSGSLTFAGANAQTPNSVTVNGTSASLYGDKTFATTAALSFNNGANTFTTVVQFASQTKSNVVTAQLPLTVAFQYDANGNLVSDGTLGFSYDDENQLTAITATNSWRTEFLYDGLSRKRVVRECTWQAGTWVRTNETRYIYDGLLAIQERDSNNVSLVSYTRGLDLSGGVQAAGGIGGLLARTDSKGSVFYHADGNGNVTALVDAQQTLEARYLYDPFGNLLGKWGPLADANRYRFSSKEWHANSGLYAFGFRYYQPNLQRWMNADPIGELGGLNLHQFVFNDPLNLADDWGMQARPITGLGNSQYAINREIGGRLDANSRGRWGRPLGPEQSWEEILRWRKRQGFESYMRNRGLDPRQSYLEPTRNPAQAIREYKPVLPACSQGLAFNPAQNVASSQRLADQLRRASAESPFTAEGKLSESAILSSREIIPAARLRNPAIPTGFSKYSTPTYQSPSGNFQVHFYRNPVTGEVFQELDYKVVFNR